MSRGPGWIERAIRKLLDAHPDLAFVTGEIVEHCFPAITTIERKHQVSALRAARKLIAGDRDWQIWSIDGPGHGWVFINHGNLQSYALGRLISDGYGSYHSKKQLLADLEPGGRHCSCVEPVNGAWYRHVQLHIAQRDGDINTAAALRDQQDAAMAALETKCFYGIRPNVKETLTQNPPFNQSVLADRIRALAAQNDPDVLRAGLAAVAAELDAAGGAP